MVTELIEKPNVSTADSGLQARHSSVLNVMEVELEATSVHSTEEVVSASSGRKRGSLDDPADKDEGMTHGSKRRELATDKNAVGKIMASAVGHDEALDLEHASTSEGSGGAGESGTPVEGVSEGEGASGESGVKAQEQPKAGKEGINLEASLGRAGRAGLDKTTVELRTCR